MTRNWKADENGYENYWEDLECTLGIKVIVDFGLYGRYPELSHSILELRRKDSGLPQPQSVLPFRSLKCPNTQIQCMYSCACDTNNEGRNEGPSPATRNLKNKKIDQLLLLDARIYLLTLTYALLRAYLEVDIYPSLLRQIITFRQFSVARSSQHLLICTYRT
eukprot:scaffold103742_cov80-Cyclotella_meneghiniana.AAC.3